MPDPYLRAMAVRPIGPDERERFDKELDRHHWLGHILVGETMRNVGGRFSPLRKLADRLQHEQA